MRIDHGVLKKKTTALPSGVMAPRKGLAAKRTSWTKGQYYPNASASRVEPLIMVRSPPGSSMPGRLYSPSLTVAPCASKGSKRDLVAHAEGLALADLYTPLNIATLCRVLAVSERTLRKAFQNIHGLPPHRYLRMLKLSRARQELMLVRGRSVTVTEIATDLGFVELGRFSVEYRRMFGESPSETLRQAICDPGGGNSAPNDRVAF